MSALEERQSAVWQEIKDAATSSAAAARAVERHIRDATAAFTAREKHLTAPHIVYDAEVCRVPNGYTASLRETGSGIVGTGSSPAAACADFDRQWNGS